MSHYFKRDNEHQVQDSSPVVPIFNTKKRRVKQALYSNPSSSQTNNFKSSFTNSTPQYNSGFRPEKATETSHENRATAAFDFSSRDKAKVPIHGASMNGHESARKKPMQSKTDWKSLQANTAQKSLPSLPKPRPQFGVGGISMKNVKFEQGNDQMKPSTSLNGSHAVELIKTKSKIDNSTKFYTATIKTVMDWEEFRDKTTAIFEIYGVLESAVSTDSSGNAKNFVLKDNTGNMRCTFWEMDRSLPRLTRGRNYRCVGSLNRKTKAFNCVIVRPANLVELRSASTSMACSEVAMQSYIATFKED